jgi:hypothetical protein
MKSVKQKIVFAGVLALMLSSLAGCYAYVEHDSDRRYSRRYYDRDDYRGRDYRYRGYDRRW